MLATTTRGGLGASRSSPGPTGAYPGPASRGIQFLCPPTVKITADPYSHLDTEALPTSAADSAALQAPDRPCPRLSHPYLARGANINSTAEIDPMQATRRKQTLV